MLPVIVISSEIAVRGVPNTLREAGLALGAKPHKVSMRIVLPAAVTGIVTGIILAISRAIGETAPVLLVIGGGYINSWKPLDPVSALPLSIYENAKSEWPVCEPKSGGIALVLVVFVFVLSLSARIWASRKQQARPMDQEFMSEVETKVDAPHDEHHARRRRRRSRSVAARRCN